MIDEMEFMGTPMMGVCVAAPLTLWLCFLLSLFFFDSVRSPTLYFVCFSFYNEAEMGDVQN